MNLDKPPPTENRKPWADWFFKLWAYISGGNIPVLTDASRGDPGQEGRVIFNSDDGQLNIDDGTNWTLPDGSTT